MYDSDDDGLCDGDSNLKKRFEFEFSKTLRPAFFEEFKNSSKRVQVWLL